MKWSLLLSTYRLGRGKSMRSDDLRTEFQKDFDRIVFSSAFRRLQDKTQIFPLSENDYVHTRLTHSIEVACVARSLGTLVGAFAGSRGEAPGISAHDFGSVASAAALAHDIGNPPFGHAGEVFIREWFSTEGASLIERLDEDTRCDLLGFDGNAQGFRVLARLQNARGHGGMQLTCAVLGAFAKYPHGPGAGAAKAGFYRADRTLFAEVAQCLGLLPVPGGAWCRHPLAYVVEAADDICYSIVDVEDGYRLGLVTYEEADELLGAIVRKSATLEASARIAMLHDGDARIGYLRAQAIDLLVADAFRVFRDNYSEIMAGAPAPSLVSGGAFGQRLERIAEFCRRRLYRVPETSGNEQLARHVIATILRTHLPPGVSSDDDAVMRVVDYVAGMTDSYAARLAGVRV